MALAGGPETQTILGNVFKVFPPAVVILDQFNDEARMKWAAGIFFAMLYLVWPYYTLLELAGAVKSADTKTLNELVDWSTLRTSLKTQLQTKLNNRPVTEAEKKSPLAAAFAAGFASKISDAFIDAAVSPQGISRLVQISRSSAPSQQAMPVAATPENASDNNLYKRVKFAFFTSPIDFRLDLRNPQTDETVTVMMLFKGSGWQVTDIRVPEADLAPKVAQAMPR